jgi:hypothetical protein
MPTIVVNVDPITEKKPLIGRILTVDTTEMEFRVFNLKADPANEVTYANRDRIEIKELDGLCAPGLSH